MALLTFPVSPTNGEIFPIAPPIGTNIYQWSAAEQTWVLLGKATGATAGTYGNAITVPQITITAAGVITVAQDVAIQLGNTTQVGLVQLVNDTASNDPTKALTAAQGYALQQQITAIDAWTANDIPLSPAINGNNNVQSALTDVVYNVSSPNLTVAEVATGQVTVTLPNTAVTPGAYTAANITVDAQGRITSATNGVNGTVTQVNTGTGLIGGPITSTGTISLANTAVTPGSYTYSSLTVDAQGRLTAASSGTPAVTTVTGTAPIVSSGGLTPTISLANTAVTPGSYTYGSFTVDAQGRLTAASSGTPAVTAVTGTAPIVSSGGLTPVISLANTAVTPGTYALATITVDAQGRITSASNGSPGAQLYHYSQLDDISSGFNGTATAFSLALGGVAYTPNPVGNLMVFLGGVAQTPGAGNAYTVSGSTITFSSAPPTGTAFYATTVTNT